MKFTPRAAVPLSYPNDAEVKRQNQYKKRGLKLR